MRADENTVTEILMKVQRSPRSKPEQKICSSNVEKGMQREMKRRAR